MFNIFFLIFLLIPMPVISGAKIDIMTEFDFRQKCSEFSENGMRECLKNIEKDSQGVLNKTEKKLINAISKWDEDDIYIRQAKSALIASNKEFIRYRKTQCALNSALNGGGAGNGREILRLACMAELNTTRTRQLAEFITGLPSR